MHYPRVVLAFPCLVLLTLPLPAQVPPSVYSQAIADLNQHKFAEAEATLKDAIRKDSQNATALGLMGVVLDAQKRYTEAQSFYRRAVQLSPDSPALLNNFGNHYFAQGKAQLARDAYLKVVHIEPHDQNANVQLARISITRKQGREALYYLGQLSQAQQGTPAVQLIRAEALRSTGDSSGAGKQLFRVLERSGDDPRVAFSVGMLFAKWQRYKDAESAFSKALESAPTDFDVLYNLGVSALDAHDFGRAGEAFRLALRERPNDASCLRGLARVDQFSRQAGSPPAHRKSELELAAAVFREKGAKPALAVLDGIPARKRTGDYFLLRAQLLDAIGKPQQAATALNLAFRSSPKRADLYFQAALFLAKHHRYEKLVLLLEKAEEFVPNDPRLQLTRAMGYELMQRHREAVDLLLQMESRWPEWATPYEIHGIILSIHFRPAQAVPILKRAIALGADNAQVYYYLAGSITTANSEDLNGARGSEAAEAAITKAVTLDPRDPYVQCLAGKIAYTHKHYQAALQHLNAALALWPDMIEARQTLSATYRALGEKGRSAAQLRAVLRIKQQTRTTEQNPPFRISDLLFSVRPPAE